MIENIREEHGFNSKNGKVLFAYKFFEFFPKYEVEILGNHHEYYIKSENQYIKLPTFVYDGKNPYYNESSICIDVDEIKVTSDFETREDVIEMFLDLEHTKNKIKYFEDLIQSMGEENWRSGYFKQKIEELEDGLFYTYARKP